MSKGGNSGSDKKTFLGQVSATSLTGRTTGDAWRQYLQSDVGGGSQQDMEMRWLRKHGGTGNTWADLWHSYLNAKGIPKGGLSSRIDMFFSTKTTA